MNGTMKIAISGETPAKAFSLEEFLKFVKNLNISAIELWPEQIPLLDGSSEYSRSYYGRNVPEAKKLLKKYEIEVACATFGGAFDENYTQNPEKYINELVKCIEVAHELGAGFVNSYLYHLCMDEKPDYSSLKKLFQPAIKAAEKYEIVLLLENEAHDSTRNPSVFKQIIETMDSPFFRANFDAVNYFQASYEGFPFCFNEVKESYSYIHIKDGCLFNPNDPTHDARCVGGGMTGFYDGNSIYYPYMGQGVLNIPGLVHALKQHGYDGWCTLEPHVPVDLWESYIINEVNYLKNLGLS